MQHSPTLPMTPACPTITLAGFQQAIASRDVQFHLSAPRYARRKILAAAPDLCPLCRSPFDRTAPRSFSAPVIATCVHTFLGGPLTVDNLFVCCRRCQQSRASTDLLTIPDLPAHLADQRLAVLQLSQNHPVSLPKSATLTDVRQALAQRHAMPRSRVYAAQPDDGPCLLGVSRRYGDRESKGLAHLLARLGGTPLHRDKRLTVYALTDADFRRVVWQLIEANAWVIGIGRRSQPRDFQDHWWVSSSSVSELRARKVGGVVVPLHVSATREVGASAVRMRRLAERRRAAREQEDVEREYREASAAYESWMATRRSPTAFPIDPEDELGIVARYGTACRRWAEAQAQPGLANTASVATTS